MSSAEVPYALHIVEAMNTFNSQLNSTISSQGQMSQAVSAIVQTAQNNGKTILKQAQENVQNNQNNTNGGLAVAQTTYSQMDTDYNKATQDASNLAQSVSNKINNTSSQEQQNVSMAAQMNAAQQLLGNLISQGM